MRRRKRRGRQLRKESLCSGGRRSRCRSPSVRVRQKVTHAAADRAGRKPAPLAVSTAGVGRGGAAKCLRVRRAVDARVVQTWRFGPPFMRTCRGRPRDNRGERKCGRRRGACDEQRVPALFHVAFVHCPLRCSLRLAVQDVALTAKTGSVLGAPCPPPAPAAICAERRPGQIERVDFNHQRLRRQAGPARAANRAAAW